MSCSEVMYQAYYPYLYQRPGGAPPVSAHPVPRAGHFSSPFASAAHQYDRFAAQRLQDSHSINQASSSGVSSLSSSEHAAAVAAAHSSLYLQGGTTAAAAAASSTVQPAPQSSLAGPHSSAGSVSSTGGISPTSPHRGKEEECSLHGRSSTEVTHHGAAASLEDSDSDEDTASSRAQYVSANCVVFTHYQGDAASQVDEHFSKALDKTTPQAKESSPMTSRNFPPSFWNSHYQPTLPANMASSSHHSELYGSEHYHPGDWYHGYSAATAAHYHHQQHMAGYSGLLLPSRGLHVPAHAHAQCKAVDWHQGVEYGTPYPGMSGLEAQVQESSKDLYWF